MAKTLTPINYTTDTPLTLITLANSIVDTLATEVVTANTSNTGALTTGNGYVSGVFGASVLIGGEVRGGAVNASANLVFSSNLTSNSSMTLLMGNTGTYTTVNSTFINTTSFSCNSASINYFALGQLTIANTKISSVTYQANSSANQVFDYFGLTVYRAAEYFISITDNVGLHYQLSKVLVIHDGTNAYVTEYGMVNDGTTVATINATANSTSLIMTVSPVTSTNATIHATRTIATV